ncbi:MAG TPA: penicillin-binding transpeptidase domain-containing protein [Jatrophihabitans sp.]|nr:penicillin-binding transpeptidase domain-containing protein [Jatrophihabitans sp.]
MSFADAVGSRRRLGLLRVLLGSLLLTLLCRLAYVQLLDPHKPQQSAGLTHLGSIVIPAPRGQILDSSGRVLVGNRSTHVLTVDRSTLQQQDDQGRSVLAALAPLLKTTAADLQREITPCGVRVPAPCWTGEPYQPVPVATDIDASVVLAISEHAEQFPGVAIDDQTVLDYPGGTLAAHLLGYTGAVSADDQKADPKLVDADTIGRSGLEESYDSVLRGTDGTRQVALDARGEAVGAAGTDAPTPGDSLVTSIDAGVQALAEKALYQQLMAQRAKGKPAPSGAVVVEDPHTGRVIAAASYPTYDPAQFVGGISVSDYAKLTAPGADDPLVGRAIDGAYAPGSTFKLISASDDLMTGAVNTTDSYPCPGSLNVDGRQKTNYDSESFGGPISLQFALDVSCDTFFYLPAVAEWHADQARVDSGQQPQEQLQKMARAFGVASSPGIDLPADEQASGSIGSRENRLALWKANKSDYCAAAKRGYPDVANPTDRAYLTQLASENCTDGWRFFAGNNADTAIGQGDTTVSPLQLATAYAAMVNGGTLFRPTLGWGVVNAAGKLVRTITPSVVRKVPVDRAYLDFFGNALHFQANHTVSGALAFDGSPTQTLIGGKTGTAEVYGKLDTSWLASWGPYQPGAPVGDSKYVVVGMITQAGTGASAAGPMLRQIWEGLLGANGAAPVTRGAKPVSTLPAIKPSLLSAPASQAAPSPGGHATAGPSSSPDALPTRSSATKPAKQASATRTSR